MSKLSLEDFNRAVKCSKLAQAIPEVSELAGQVGYTLWKDHMENLGSLTKEKIFVAGLGIALKLSRSGSSEKETEMKKIVAEEVVKQEPAKVTQKTSENTETLQRLYSFVRNEKFDAQTMLELANEYRISITFVEGFWYVDDKVADSFLDAILKGVREGLRKEALFRLENGL